MKRQQCCSFERKKLYETRNILIILYIEDRFDLVSKHVAIVQNKKSIEKYNINFQINIEIHRNCFKNSAE